MVRVSFRVWAVLVISALSVLLLPSSASADTRQRALGFTNLVLRVDKSSDIAIAPDEYRVHLLERLRALGLNAVGAESLVFAKDEQAKAELLLGGTIRRLDCRAVQRALNCRMAIQWELLDVASDQVVYEATTSHAVYRIDKAHLDDAGKRLATGALESLVRREKFRAALGKVAEHDPDPTYSTAKYRVCETQPQPMPGGTNVALQATVVVESERGFGSGFFLTGEGLVVTAAHVVQPGKLTVRFNDGTEVRAVPIRTNPRRDIALLRLVAPRATPCLPLDDRRELVGTDVYAIGSPASRELAFSVTRGIVSGARSFDGVEFWQTDASINPGNSGGPLLTVDGKVIAVASWKIVGSSVEGIAFGVPIHSGLRGLGLEPGDATASDLTRGKPIQLAAPSVERIVDGPDAVPSLDPEGDRRRELSKEAEVERRQALEAEQKRDEERDRLTPTYVKVMRYGGPTLAGAGLLGVVVSASAFDKETSTEPEYQRLRLTNDLGWVAVGVGGAAFALSFVLTPSVPSEEARRGSVSVALSTQGLALKGEY
jgi:S1-C subfamily serine protease